MTTVETEKNATDTVVLRGLLTFVAENLPLAADESFIDSVEQSIALQLAVDRTQVRVTQFGQEQVRRLQETSASKTKITIGFEVLPSDPANVQSVVASFKDPTFTNKFTDKVMAVESSKGRTVNIKEVEVAAPEIAIVSLSSTTSLTTSEDLGNANQRLITTTMSDNVNKEDLDADSEASDSSIVHTAQQTANSTTSRNNTTVVGEGVAVRAPTATGSGMTVWIVVIVCIVSALTFVSSLWVGMSKLKRSNVAQESTTSTGQDVQATEVEIPNLLRSISHQFVKNAASPVLHLTASVASLSDAGKESGEADAPDTAFDDLDKWLTACDVVLDMPRRSRNETELPV